MKVEFTASVSLLSVLSLLLFASCGSGLQALNGSSGVNGNQAFLEPIGIYTAIVSDTGFTDTVGSSYPPSYEASPVSAAQFNELIIPTNPTPVVFNTGASCTTSPHYAVVDFIFDVGGMNLTSFTSMTLSLNGASAGYSLSSSLGPNSGQGVVEAYNSSSGWIQGSTDAVPDSSTQINFSLNASPSFNQWVWTPTSAPGSGNLLLFSLRSTSCPSTPDYSAVSLNSAMLAFYQ